MTTINANGGAHVATCCKCGASLTYPIWVDTRKRSTGEIVKSEAYGADCFETVFGHKWDRIPSKYRQGNRFDREQFDADRGAQLAAREAAQAVEAERVAAAVQQNAWLVAELRPFGVESTYDQRNGLQYTGKILDNFAGSIITSLMNGIPAVELPEKAKRIIIDIVAKGQGRRNSKAYDAKETELMDRLFPEA